MPRIRTVKPEFWADEKLSLLDVTTRLVFIGLICMADDAGRLIDNVKLLDGMLFPSTDDSCRDALDTLARLSRIIRYRSSSGQALIQIANWEKHQKVDKKAKYTLPGPETAVAVQPPVAQSDTRVDAELSRESRESVESASRDSRETLAESSRSDLRPPTSDLRPPTSDLPAPRARRSGRDPTKQEAARRQLAEWANDGTREASNGE